METSFKEQQNPLNDLYSAEQQSAILQVLNMASEKELSSIRLLRGKRSVNIIEYRLKHGPFQNVKSLLAVPLFQHKTIVKVCDFILNPSGRTEGERQVTKSSVKFIKPKIERERLQATDNIVSVVFGTRKIAWAYVDRNLSVRDWQQERCDVMVKGSPTPAMYLENISSVVSKIPEADFYVLEKNELPTQNASLFSVTLHLHIVEAMLYTLLHKTFMQDGKHKVVSMARNVVGKYFGLMVRQSRSSGMALVKQFLSDSVTEKQPRVSFPQDKMMCYKNLLNSSMRNRPEEMCDSLLQAVAFYELVINDTP
uniref:Transcription elongation factor, mitochondrial n=1 Tax=Sphenodon punctatus TaxID=8508 RepID=A0A8D0GGV2_SPHPU